MPFIIQSYDYKYHFYVYRSNIYVQPKPIHWQLCFCLSSWLIIPLKFLCVSNLTHSNLNLWFSIYSQFSSSSVCNLQCHPSTSSGWNLRITLHFVFLPFSYSSKEYANKSCSVYFHKNYDHSLSHLHCLPWLLPVISLFPLASS